MIIMAEIKHRNAIFKNFRLKTLGIGSFDNLIELI